MKTMKFAPIREKRQELYNVEDFTLNQFNFNGINKKVYSNVNLSIFVDDYCNADCKFCVAQLRFENRAQLFKKGKIQNNEEYYKRIDDILEYLKPINPSISITGGEPTKSKRLPKILELINKHGYRKRTLTTNGSGLFDIMDGKTVLQHIIDNGFAHLNISKAHHNESINRDIMRYDTGYCSNEDIETIATIALTNGLRPRLSCLLLKEGISSIEDMVEYMRFYQNLGIDNVIFRELMDFDKNKMINAEKMQYNLDNKIKLNDLWSNIDNDKRFTPIRNLLGYYYYVEVYKFENIDMCSEGANLVKLYDEKEKHKDVVYEMVLHPNGNLNGSWVDNEDILNQYCPIGQKRVVETTIKNF
jgi:molybdenum cofactor biosynthesis enzyme MoaA